MIRYYHNDEFQKNEEKYVPTNPNHTEKIKIEMSSGLFLCTIMVLFGMGA